MILQLNPTIDVKTPLGDAEALIIIDYGVNTNSVWLCRMKGGEVKHFYSDDIRVYDNPMNGNGWDVEGKQEQTPDTKLIDSMAMRYRHDFGLLSEEQKQSIRNTMKQLWEEVVGLGFYKPTNSGMKGGTNDMPKNWDKEEASGYRGTISKQKIGDSDYTYCIENWRGDYAHGYRKNGLMNGIWVFRDATDTGNILRSSVYMNGEYIKDLEIK